MPTLSEKPRKGNSKKTKPATPAPQPAITEIWLGPVPNNEAGLMALILQAFHTKNRCVIGDLKVTIYTYGVLFSGREEGNIRARVMKAWGKLRKAGHLVRLDKPTDQALLH